MTPLLDRYLSVFPDEQERVRIFADFLRATTNPAQLFDRKNFNGHITASGFVLSPDGTELAVVDHAFLKRHLQPGGHVEGSDENILAAAMREIREETDIREFRQIPFRGETHFPIDIDTHEIPANPKKNEARHYHYDFRFVFQVDKPVVPQSQGWCWRPLETAISEESHAIVYRKLRTIFAKF